MISNFSNKIMHLEKPNLNGLILAGGKSSRMGKNKSLTRWHGKEQLYYMADLLKKFCVDVFISCRKEQEFSISKEYATVPDMYEGLGPYGAILSAFKFQPSAAWLVVACDLPLLDEDTLAQLVTERDPSVIATTFTSPHDSLPEPLVTIWEPQSFSLLQNFLSEGYQCPRKILLKSTPKIITARNELALRNVNTPEEEEQARQLLNLKQYHE
jgi:molybdopterin-guanine dinucleotide biosynthesis protein A